MNIFRIVLISTVFFCTLSSSFSFAESAVRVMALFPGKAMVSIEGKNKVLREGQQE